MTAELDLDVIISGIDSNEELREAFAAAARRIQDRNEGPRSLSSAIKDPESTELLELLEAHVRIVLDTPGRHFGSMAPKSQSPQRILAQIFNESPEPPLPSLTEQLAVLILPRYADGVDRYVEALSDFTLVKGLNLEVDDDGLTNLRSTRLRLLDHGLQVDQDIRLYLHQFLRRYFSGNFVNLPRILSKALGRGHEVKVRIDPLRRGHMADYVPILEEDYWFGPKFSSEILDSTDRRETRTVHGTDETTIASQLLGVSYPVYQTDFRSSMLGEGLRQFSIEEYAPLITRFGGKSPGFGKRYHIQKFAHFVYNQEIQTFEHVDCAVRVHEIEDYEGLLNRAQEGLDPGRRTGDRFKLFKVSGQLELSLVQELLYEYFRYNLHIAEYFGNLTAEEAFSDIKSQ